MQVGRDGHISRRRKSPCQSFQPPPPRRSCCCCWQNGVGREGHGAHVVASSSSPRGISRLLHCTCEFQQQQQHNIHKSHVYYNHVCWNHMRCESSCRDVAPNWTRSGGWPSTRSFSWPCCWQRQASRAVSFSVYGKAERDGEVWCKVNGWGQPHTPS